MTAASATKELADAGAFGVITAPATVRFERLLPGPVERVWGYLTEPDKIGKWLAAGSINGEVGGTIELTWNHAQLSRHVEPTPERFKKYQGAVTTWRITRFEPPRAMRVLWDEGGNTESDVTFELIPRDKKVLLIVTHARIPNREAMLDIASGWHTHLAILGDNAEGQEPRPYWSTWSTVREEYAKQLAQSPAQH